VKHEHVAPFVSVRIEQDCGRLFDFGLATVASDQDALRAGSIGLEHIVERQSRGRFTRPSGQRFGGWVDVGNAAGEIRTDNRVLKRIKRSLSLFTSFFDRHVSCFRSGIKNHRSTLVQRPQQPNLDT
jgi:hypothetical protein